MISCGTALIEIIHNSQKLSFNAANIRIIVQLATIITLFFTYCRHFLSFSIIHFQFSILNSQLPPTPTPHSPLAKPTFLQKALHWLASLTEE